MLRRPNNRSGLAVYPPAALASTRAVDFGAVWRAYSHGWSQIASGRSIWTSSAWVCGVSKAPAMAKPQVSRAGDREWGPDGPFCRVVASRIDRPDAFCDHPSLSLWKGGGAKVMSRAPRRRRFVRRPRRTRPPRAPCPRRATRRRLWEFLPPPRRRCPVLAHVPCAGRTASDKFAFGPPTWKRKRAPTGARFLLGL